MLPQNVAPRHLRKQQKQGGHSHLKQVLEAHQRSALPALEKKNVIISEETGSQRIQTSKTGCTYQFNTQFLIHSYFSTTVHFSIKPSDD
jgi:hypothetical protein